MGNKKQLSDDQRKVIIELKPTSKSNSKICKQMKTLKSVVDIQLKVHSQYVHMQMLQNVLKVKCKKRNVSIDAFLTTNQLKG